MVSSGPRPLALVRPLRPPLPGDFVEREEVERFELVLDVEVRLGFDDFEDFDDFDDDDALAFLPAFEARFDVEAGAFERFDALEAFAAGGPLEEGPALEAPESLEVSGEAAGALAFAASSSFAPREDAALLPEAEDLPDVLPRFCGDFLSSRDEPAMGPPVSRGDVVGVSSEKIYGQLRASAR